MKPFITITAFLLVAGILKAQESRPAFRKGYTRLGIQTMNNTLENNLSPGDNIRKGNLGTGTGFVLERGHIFYFIPADKASFINAGIDWTIFSFTYSSSAKQWDKYASANNAGGEDFLNCFVASASTKAGGVISINPVKDLVIDVRAQASFGAYYIGPKFDPLNNDKDYFYTYIDHEGSAGIKKITQYISTAIKPNVGTSIRWRGIGLAADYSPGKTKMDYTQSENSKETTDTEHVRLNTLQVKLSLNF